ncbi:hypothetical protein MRB53_040097 [Persea americana]|nr:hypothetical protein MRB53_040097 [Persea americana]
MQSASPIYYGASRRCSRLKTRMLNGVLMTMSRGGIVKSRRRKSRYNIIIWKKSSFKQTGEIPPFAQSSSRSQRRLVPTHCIEPCYSSKSNGTCAGDLMNPSHPQDLYSSANDRNNSANSQRHGAHAWGAAPGQQPATRRGLPPLSTSGTSQLPRPSSSSQSRTTWSPLTSVSNPVHSQTGRATARSPSISSATSPFSPPLGVPQASQSGSFPRNTGSASSQYPGNPQSSSQRVGLGQAGSAGGPRLARNPPALQSPSYALPTLSTPTSAAAGQSGSLAKIIVAQIFLLLSSIKDDKDKAKFDSQAEQIRQVGASPLCLPTKLMFSKLVSSHGMDVFTKYFRRLLQNNSATVWPSLRNGESGPTYQLLVTEVQNVSQDAQQSAKIVEAIDGGEGDLYRDFDLSTFMEHFKLGPIAKIILATAFKKASRSDLRTKADAIISSNLQNYFSAIAVPPAQIGDSLDTNAEALLVLAIERTRQRSSKELEP